MEIKIHDLLGNELQIGDKVAFGEKSSTSTAFLQYGEIILIQQRGFSQIEVLVKIIKSGAWPKWYVGKIRRFIFPRNYDNLIKIQ